MNIEELLQNPLWDNLKNKSDPILLYGMGNGADKIIACCEKYNIKISGVFASDGFVRKKEFHGMPIRSFAESKKIFGKNMVVLLSFATSLPDVLENIQKISSEVTLYAPDVPVYGDTLFEKNFLINNFDSFKNVYSMFADERSKKLYKDIIKYKISGNISFLRESDSESEYMKDILHAERFTSYVDAGAYKGDTILRQKIYSPNLNNVFAIEPDPSTYNKLLLGFENDIRSPKAFNFALSDHEGESFFHGGGGRGSTVNVSAKKMKRIRLSRLDTLLENECDKIDFIKYDVEGSEYEALLGSVKTINESRPAMLVSLYHRSEDLFKLPLLIKELYPNTDFYLRRLTGIPAWDINLLVVPK